jgi:hypothetical protein
LFNFCNLVITKIIHLKENCWICLEFWLQFLAL